MFGETDPIMCHGVDVIRCLLIIECAVTAGLLIDSIARVWRHMADDGNSELGRFDLGRMARIAATVFLIVASAHGFVDRWGDPYTIRVVLVQIALVLCIYSWRILDRQSTFTR